MFKGSHKYESHVPFPTAHVNESLLNENSVELKTKQKYQMLISGKENPDSDKDGLFFKDYNTNIKSKSPRTITHSVTDINRKLSPKFPDDLALKQGTLSRNDVITILPEGKWI